MALRPYLSTALACTLAVLVSAPVHCGFMLVLLSPFLLVWLAYSMRVMRKTPARRPTQKVKLALWGGVIAVVAALHGYYYLAARQAGNAAVQAVLAYHTAQGRYPDSLAQAGSDLGRDDAPWRVVYKPVLGQPLLYYAGSFTVFETYSYDFERRVWVYRV